MSFSYLPIYMMNLFLRSYNLVKKTNNLLAKVIPIHGNQLVFGFIYIMKYNVSYRNPLTHLIDITLEIDNIKEGQVLLQLPSWRPGRYEIANFAKNILSIEAFDVKGNRLEIKKSAKDQWVIQTAKNSFVKVNYNYYAYQMDAGNSWLDDEQIYINFINCMLYAQDRLQEACIVNLDLPKDYQIACGLTNDGHRTLTAESYYQLVDSPMIASNDLERHEYEADGNSFSIWIQGEHQVDTVKMLNDFEQFTKFQITAMGDFPCKAYHFLIQALPYKHYHGVEHQNSTTITLGPARELENKPLYNALLGISSHELFHTWNVIRIRPKEMLPYDFTKENYFDTGYVAEGFTTYYGDLFLVRSGVLDFDWYLNKINRMLRSHFENFGRANMSVADSSIDLWLDGYQHGIPNRKVSIYNEGAIIALLLDLQIRVESNHEKSLDNVVRQLWLTHGKLNIGYDSNSILKILEGLIEFDWQDFFKSYIYGTAPIEEHLLLLLQNFGCELVITSSDVKNESQFGFRIDDNNCITKIQPHSIAEQHLSLGDSVINLEETIVSNDDLITFEIERNYKHVSTKIPQSRNKYFEYYQIHLKEHPTPEERNALKKWVNV